MPSVSARLHPSIYLACEGRHSAKVPHSTLTGIALARGFRHESGITRQVKLSLPRLHSSSNMAETQKEKNIAFFHPDLGIGGAERLIIDAAVGLQKRGHKVVIFTSHCDPQHCFDEARDGICLCHLNEAISDPTRDSRCASTRGLDSPRIHSFSFHHHLRYSAATTPDIVHLLLIRDASIQARCLRY